MTSLAIKELIHIDVHAVSASGQDHAFNSSLIETLGKIFTLLHTLIQIIEIQALIKADSQSHDVPAGHSAVGVIAIAGNLLDFQLDTNIVRDAAVIVKVRNVFPKEALVTVGQNPTHIGMTILLQGGGKAVAVGEHLFGDFCNRFIGISIPIA